MQLDQTKMYSITIVFRSWSCSFPPVEVADQSTVQNSQTVLVALLSLMQLMKVSNADSGGESNVCFVISMIIPVAFLEKMRLKERRIYFVVHVKVCKYIVFHTTLVFLQFSSINSGLSVFHVDTS